MGMFEEEAKAFREAKDHHVAEARQCAAFFLIAGIDLAAALETSGEERAAILRRLERLIERERLKGMRRHWSYDLNRHIALKQVYDRLTQGAPGMMRLRARRRGESAGGPKRKRRRSAAFSSQAGC